MNLLKFSVFLVLLYYIARLRINNSVCASKSSWRTIKTTLSKTKQNNDKNHKTEKHEASTSKNNEDNLHKKTDNEASTSSTNKDQTSSSKSVTKLKFMSRLKINSFRRRVSKLKRSHQYKGLKIERSKVFEQSFAYIVYIDEPRYKLAIEFVNEEFKFHRGLTDEWFAILSTEIFNPEKELFGYCTETNYELQINPYFNLSTNEGSYMRYWFAGKFIGLAILHKIVLHVPFSTPFLKHILGEEVTIDDVKETDEVYYGSLQHILNNDPKDLEMVFAEEEILKNKKIVIHDLKLGGRDISVTNENKEEYIDLLIKWRYGKRVFIHMNEFKRGLFEVIPSKEFKMLNLNELRFIICGTQIINFNDWKSHTHYQGFTKKSKVVEWFWSIVENYDDEKKIKLLKFVTGSPVVPTTGFAEFERQRKPFMLVYWKDGDKHQSLPKSYTCTRRLYLPKYKNRETMEEKLTDAIKQDYGYW